MGLSTANTSIISSDRGKPSAPVTCDRFLPIKCSTERFNKDFLAKTPTPQRKIFSYFSELGVLCPVEYSHVRGVNVALVTLFHRGESSFIRFPKPKFNGKFQICLDSICLPRSTRRSRRIYNQIISAPAFQTPCRYNLIPLKLFISC